MSYLVPISVFLLMVSIGMSLRPAEVMSSLRRLTWLKWLRLVFAAFLLPAALALALARLFGLTDGDLGGIFMVGVTPGAPLLTRNVARKGFDMHLAATYQLLVAFLIPILIPLVVAAGASLYNKEIWISPATLVKEVALKQLVPLAIGVLIAKAAPTFSTKYRTTFNVLGNLLLTLVFVFALIKIGPALKNVTPKLPVAALLLALGCMGIIWLMRLKDPIVTKTFAIANANRHVGLALLLTGRYTHSMRALPAIACYALVVVLVMIAYGMWFRGGERKQELSASEAESSIASS